jgi:hypothetical protein
MWNIYSTDEYIEWFSQLDNKAKEEILEKAYLLKEFGPELSRPYADTLKGVKVSNLKELRGKTDKHLLRVAYYFDPARNGILLIGGDKKGKPEKLFYKNLIRKAEELIEKYKGRQWGN